jgi:UPF0716 family protein affecting phage T7 exclusion
MLARLIWAALGLAVLDLYLVYLIWRAWGLWAALAMVLAPPLLGALLARWQYRASREAVSGEIAAGRSAFHLGIPMLGIPVARVLMSFPGPVTTVLGLLLMAPFIRRPVLMYVFPRLPGLLAEHFGGDEEEEAPPAHPGDAWVYTGDGELREAEGRVVDSTPEGRESRPALRSRKRRKEQDGRAADT